MHGFAHNTDHEHGQPLEVPPKPKPLPFGFILKVDPILRVQRPIVSRLNSPTKECEFLEMRRLLGRLASDAKKGIAEGRGSA